MRETQPTGTIMKSRGGNFVYQGSGKKGNKPCSKQACDIQWCLARRNYQEKHCQHVIDRWKKCVEEHELKNNQKEKL